MSTRNETPYDEGYSDGFHGRSYDNPYAAGSSDYDDYESGYSDGASYRSKVS